MPIRRPVIQHSSRRPVYTGAQINTSPQRITNDIIKIELDRTTEAGVRNIRKSTLKCNCRLTLNKVLKHGNCSNKDTKKEIDIQNTPDEAKRISYGIENDGEEPEILENDSLIQISDINDEYDIMTPETNQEKLEIDLEDEDENVVPEFEAPGYYSSYVGGEIENPVNKSEIDEETEQELQGNDEFKVGYDNEQTIEHAQMLQANDENAQILQPNEETDVSKPNDKLKIEILKNIVIKHATKSHSEILKTIREIIVLKKGNSSSKVASIDDVTAQEVFVHNSNVNEQINDGKDDDEEPEIPENDGEEPEIPENDSLIQMSDINVEYDIMTPATNQEKLEIDLEAEDENVVPEFEAPGNYSSYVGGEIENPVNKSEIDEETEQELQGNDEFKVGYDNEKTIEHAQMLQANDENAQILQPNEEADVSKPNDKLKIEILKNIVIKHATKSHSEILKTIRDIIVLKKGNSSSNVASTDDVSAQEVFVHNSNVNEQINDGRDKILQANNEIVLKQTNSNVEAIHNIDPKSNEPTTENTSTRSKETEITDKSPNENTEKAPQFDNFKVPKDVTHSKKKRVKKQQPRFVLTHVVDGHIIQESNFAFPIREPQSQKNEAHTSNTEVTAPSIEEKQENEEESGTKETPPPTEEKEEERSVQEECVTKGPTPTEMTKEVAVVKEDCVTEEPAPIELKEDLENGEFNPFARLQQSTVKSWTVEDLSNHLLKCDWEETASLLQDNEIDGASLFMVTKTQLMIIGVNEEQADVISEFIQSGSSKGN